MSQTERIYWIHAQILAGLYPNADTVSEQFEVSRRTAYADRDLMTLRLNAPLRYDRSRRGWTYTDKTFTLPLLAMNERDSKALARTLLIAREYVGVDDAEILGELARRLGAYLPPVSNSATYSASGSLHSSDESAVAPELLTAIDSAIADRQKVRLTYYSAHRDATKDRIVHPYHVHNHLGEWHLIAWCELRQDVRQFYLGRVRGWKVLPEPGAYSFDRSFNITEYLSKGFGALHGDELVEVRLIFSAHQARWIRERRYHPSQQTAEIEEGRLEVKLSVAGLEEILRWVRSYGPDVEVVEPEQLRRLAKESAKKVLEIYEKD